MIFCLYWIFEIGILAQQNLVWDRLQWSKSLGLKPRTWDLEHYLDSNACFGFLFNALAQEK